MKNITKLCLFLSFILGMCGCEKSKEDYVEQLKESLINKQGFEIWNPYPSNTNDLDYKTSNYFVRVIEGDANDVSKIFETTTFYYMINTENLTLDYFLNDIDNGIRNMYTYDYKTDIVTGNYLYIDAHSYVRKKYSMLYNFSNGVSECLLTENMIDKFECSIAEIYAYELKQSKKKFLDIIEKSGVDINQLYSRN